MKSQLSVDHGQYFAASEFMCKCDACEYPGMDAGLVNALDRMRAQLGAPIRITSGYRCPAHNAAVSSTGADGPHTTGMAVDISCYGELAHKLICEATVWGFSGIGIAQKGARERRFIHLDVITAADALRPWIWSY